MTENEELLRKRFAKNLSTYRKALGLTQIELAEKLNYSDKSVSKWERGEGLPDLAVTAQIADIFGLSINDLIAEKPRRHLLTTRNKIIITLLSVGVTWLLATVLFALFEILLPQSGKWWLFYIYAIPVSAIVAIVFSCIWWKKLHTFLSISTLVWSLALCVVLSFSVQNIWLFFIIALVMQILTVLWFLIKKQ